MLIALLQWLSDFSVDHPWWTSVLTVLVTAHVSRWIKSRRFRFPPGPTGLPLLGYLPFLGPHPHRELAKLQQTYGSVFSLSLGNREAVVLGDYRAIKEANEQTSFLGNVRGLFRFSEKVQHFSELPLGPWKESYDFTLTSLRKLAEGKNKLEEFIKSEVATLEGKLLSSTGRTEINLRNFLTPVVTRITTFMVCGKNLSQDADLASSVDDFHINSWDRFKTKVFTTCIPLVSLAMPHLNPRLRDIKRNVSETTALLRKEVDIHEKKVEGQTPQDYMDYFINEMKKKIGDPATFTKKTLTGNSLLLLNSGIAGTSSQIQWILLLMAKYPDIQDKVHKEIVQLLGTDTPPSWCDHEKLPYLDAVISEAARIKTVSPLGTPHSTLSAAKVNYYDISKNTLVIQNLHAVHMDPSLWDDPEEFNPDRFLLSDGKRIQDPDHFMPFSYGKRQCPGRHVAQMQVFLVVSSLLQSFKVLPPLSGLNLDECMTQVMSPESPFVKIQSREHQAQITSL